MTNKNTAPDFLFCSECQTEHPKSDFYKNKATESGYTNICKEKLKLRARAAYESNKESRKEQISEWNDSNREKTVKYKKKYRDSRKKNN